MKRMRSSEKRRFATLKVTLIFFSKFISNLNRIIASIVVCYVLEISTMQGFD